MKVALIIVTCNDPERIRKHLDLLEKQTALPDTIIIVNTGSSIDMGRRPGLNLEVLDAGDIGPAGGFREGAKKAVSEGHDLVIFADDDAYPADRDNIKFLLEDAERGFQVVCGRYANGIRCFHTNHYLMVHKEVLAKTGFHFAPYFIYMEDIDLFHRIKKAADVHYDPRIVVDHKTMGILSDPKAMPMTKRNRLVFITVHNNIVGYFSYCFKSTLSALFTDLVLRKPASINGEMKGFWFYLTGKMGRYFGQEDKLELPSVPESKILNADCFFVPSAYRITPLSGKLKTVPVRSAMEGFRTMMRNRGKDIVVEGLTFMAHPPFTLLARNVYLYDANRKRFFFFYRNRPLLNFAFPFLLVPLVFIALLPLFILAFVLRYGYYRSLYNKQMEEDREFCKRYIKGGSRA